MPARVRCRYCEQIHLVDPRYRVRTAKQDLDASYPRCDIHWRFVCDTCGRSHHFNGVAWCGSAKKFLCIQCAPRHRAVRKGFWRWTYHYALACVHCGREHPALDRLEFEGRHPWQRSAALRRAKRGLSPEPEIALPFTFEVLEPGEDVTDRKIAAQWDAIADVWTSGYTDRGDLSRRYVIDPALLRIVGDVRGLRVFDAGCGNGYLARLLARDGAEVHAQDISRRFLEIARGLEAKEPLGIAYRQGSIVDLSPYTNGFFDVAVSNVVLQDVRDFETAVREIARVLKPGGRFVFSIVHPAFGSPPVRGWVQEPRDSHRNEDRLHVKVDRYLERATERWGFGDLPQSTTFHRPLTDYFAALSDAGLLVRRLEEPVPTKEAIEERPRDFLHEYDRIPYFLILEAVKPA